MPTEPFLLGIFRDKFALPISREGEAEFLSRFRRETPRRRTTLFMNGETNTRHYFVEKGLIRLFLLDPKGREFNLLFAYEGQFLGDLATPSPTRFNLETIEDSILYSIDDEGLRQLDLLAEEHSKYMQDTFRRSYLFLQKRLVSILSRTAEDNYLELRDRNPDLLARLPQYHVASYLGVSPEFLSKIIARTARR